MKGPSLFLQGEPGSDCFAVEKSVLKGLVDWKCRFLGENALQIIQYLRDRMSAADEAGIRIGIIQIWWCVFASEGKDGGKIHTWD
jgi:hypothetical protein